MPRYTGPAIALHWLVAIGIIANVALAWIWPHLADAQVRPAIDMHKSIGITVLLLSLARLAWRLVSPPPPLPPAVEGWARTASAAVYVLFYVVMIGMPLSGWALSSASVIIRFKPIMLFGLVQWPTITPLARLPSAEMKQAHDAFVTVHGLLAKLAYALIVLHVGAALRHLFLLKDGVAGRMVPFLKAPA